jgi:CheY-like chemotaxis protein
VDRKTVLVVDDDHNMARTVRDILQDRGYQAVVAQNGKDALAAAKEERFFCVISDIKMPEMDGVALFHALQESQPKLPILLMTAYLPGQLLDSCVENGVVAVLTKPLNIDLLFTYLKALEEA